jgi:xanthine/uracil permease
MSCTVYCCILEIIINILARHHFPTLLFGRVLEGISTNLLFSAFESWMTTQHRHLGFPECWLQTTYSQMSIGNRTMAILANPRRLCILTHDETVEFSVGLFNPVAGILRSKYVPDNLQGGS